MDETALEEIIDVSLDSWETSLMSSGLAFESGRSPDPVTSDMVVIDEKYPPDYSPINFQNGGETLHGAIYLAQGLGPNPCLLMIPEVGGYDRMASLIFPVLNAGISVCYFYPRGMWSGPNAYSLPNAVDDVKAAVAYLRTASCVEMFRLDPGRIALCGYSGGGATVGLAAAREEPSITQVAAILPFDFDRTEREDEIASTEFQQATTDASAGRQAVLSMSPADYDRVSIIKHATELAGKTLLIVSASNDVFNPLDAVHEPIISALKASGAQHLTEVVLDSDHLLLTKRIELARVVVGWLKKDCLF